MEEKLSHSNSQTEPKKYSLRMIRWNMLDIPQIPFPEGFGARPMSFDEQDEWLDVIRASHGEASASVPGKFRHEFGDDREEIEKRCFFVTGPGGVIVGTFSAWHWDFQGEDMGLIHWVAIKREYQGHGLGKAGLTYVMNRMAEMHDSCFLHTSSDKIPAVCMYLNFGFEPDISQPDLVEGWRYVKEVTNHPALAKYDL